MRALIVGVDGMIGRALLAALAAAGVACTGTSRRPDRAAAVHRLDLREAPDVDALPAADMAFLCAGLAKEAACLADPAQARQVNVESPIAIARAMRGRGASVVLLSSTAVFDGSTALRGEAEATCPRTAYGRLKEEAECRILDLGGTAVLRLTKVFPRDMPLLAGWRRALSAGEAIKPLHDTNVAPVTLSQVTDALVALGRARAEGIFHQSAARDVSYAAIARHLAARLHADVSLIRPWSRSEAGIVEPDWGPHTCLATGRLTRLTGFQPPEPLDVGDWACGSA
jgi:dTDP-4-dehydrorhamnose reductase